MKEKVDRIISEKVSECGGDIDKLRKSLSDYFNVPLEDIHANVKVTMPIPESVIKEEPINVNLSINVNNEEDTEIFDENIEEAREEGIYEGKLEVARSLLEHGMGFCEILKITGLDESDLDIL